MQALIDACRSGAIPGEVALVLTTTPGAPALERAAAAGVEARYVSPEPGGADLDRRLAGAFTERQVDLVCLTGYMRLLGPEFLTRFPQRVMNIHPALLPAFGGKGCFGRRVHEAVLESGARFSGVTIQFADAEYDRGPIILQAVVPVLDDDTPESLAARVLIEEHRLYPEAIRLFARGRLEVQGRRVRIVPDKLPEEQTKQRQVDPARDG